MQTKGGLTTKGVSKKSFMTQTIWVVKNRNMKC